MEVNFAISMKAPPLNIDLTEDVMWGFRKYCEKFGGKKMNQAGLKALQCVPIAHAALAVKQGEDMKSGLRNTAMSRSMQEIAVPGWIKVIEAAIKESERELVFPVGFKDALYYTTLGTGENPRQTFTENPKALFTKYKGLKTDYTKQAALWFDTHPENSAELNSGTQTTDALEDLAADMYRQSMKGKTTKEDAAADIYFNTPRRGAEGAVVSGVTTTSPLPTPAADAAIAATEPSQATSSTGAAAAAGDDDDDSSPLALARRAAEAARREAASPTASGSGSGASPARAEGNEDVPDDYYYPYLLLSCVWSSWSGSTPSEWKHLEASSGPRNRASKGGSKVTEDSKENDKTSPKEVVITDDNPIGCPRAMALMNANGDAVSRRQYFSNVKKKRGQAKKDAKEKENVARRHEALETRKRGLAAMESANTHVADLSSNIKKMAQLREESNQAARTKDKIEALERKLMLQIGDPNAIKAQLNVLLDEY